MRKLLLFNLSKLFMLAVMLLGINSAFGQTTYSYTFTSQVYTANNQTKTLGAVDWLLTNNGNFYGTDATKGQQIGSSGNPASTMTLSTSGISGTISSVKIYTSGASSVVATVGVNVGSTAFGTPTAITATSTPYTFTGSSTGAITINWSNSSAKALYIKQIDVTYSSVPTYAVAYDGNTSTSGTAPATVNYAEGATVTVAGQGTLVKTNFNFNGWNTSADGTGTDRTVGSTFLMPATAVTLYAKWVANTTPSITATGTLAAVNTTYGTASATPTAFSVSGINLTSGITVTPPNGFEVSQTSATTGYATSITIPLSSATAVNATTVYLRLAATTNVGTYNGNINLQSDATTQTIATVASTVSAKQLTITGLTGNNKEYDRGITATVTGTATLTGIVSTDDVTLSGTPVFTFADKTVATGKTITATGYVLSGAKAGNYTVAQPTGLTGNITAKSVTITGATASNKVYDGGVTATINNATIVGLISPDAVTVTGTFTSVNVADNIIVNTALTGNDAVNYTLTQPTLTANITKATPVFTTTAISLGVNGTYTLPGANITSTSSGTYTYSLDNTVASISVTTLTAGATAGSAILTVNQAATSNYNAATTTVPVNVTAITYVSGDYMTTGSGNWVSNSATPAIWLRHNGTTFVTSNSPNYNTTNNVYIESTHAITATGAFASGVNLKIKGTFNTSTSPSTSASLYVYDGGTLTINGTLTNGGGFEVENNGTVNINAASITGSGNLWNGDENFHAGSTFNIQNFLYNGNRLVETTSKINTNANGYYFGNLIVSGTPSSNFVLVNGAQTVKLAENDVTIATTGTPSPVTITNGSALANITLGGNLKLNSGTLNLTAGLATVVVLGNFEATGGTININTNTSTANFSTTEIKQNFTLGSSVAINSTDVDSRILFSGAAPQTLSIATTLGTNAWFEVASGSEVQLINQDLALTNINNQFTVATGGTLNFNNFNVTGNGKLIQQTDGTLKITSAAGITTSGATGNVQTATRTYSATGNYSYVGNATPQVTGNAVTAAKTITVEKTNTTDVVTSSAAIATLTDLNIKKGTFNAGGVTAGGTGTNLTVSADGKYKTAGAGIKPDATGTYALNAASTLEFYGTDATTIRVTPTYGKVLVSGNNVGLASATTGLAFATGGSFEVSNGARFKVANASGFNGGTATAITTTGTPSIVLGTTSTIDYNTTENQTVTAVNITGDDNTDGYGNLTVSNSGAKTLAANLIYVRNDFNLESVATAHPTFSVETGKTLKVKNAVNNNTTSTTPASNFTVQNNGALLQVNNVSNAGNITVIKNTNPLYRYDYTMWSSPITGQTLGSFSPETAPTRFYEYKYALDTETSTYKESYYAVPSSTVFAPAKSYLIRMPNIVNVDGYVTGDTAITFNGQFAGNTNNGTITTPLSKDGLSYTAIGNPYASPINLAEFFAANATVLDTDTGIYLWRKRNDTKASTYAVFNLSGFVANAAAGGGADQAGLLTEGNSNTWQLATGQGFFVKTISAAANPVVTFTNSMRRPANSNIGFLRQGNTTDVSRLWLNLTDDNKAFSQTAVAYIDGATTGLDYGYDAKQMSSTNTIALYSIAANSNLAIQARPAFNVTDVVTMGFVTNNAGKYAITLDHVDGVFNENQDIYLKDNLLGTTQNLKDGAYNFNTDAGTFTNRFEVVYTKTTLGINNPEFKADNVIVFKQGNAININSDNAQITSVTIYDMRGRKLYNQNNINNIQTVINGLAVQEQVLIVEVNTAKGKVSKKIIF